MQMPRIRVATVTEVAAGDGNAAFTVPTGKYWQLKAFSIYQTASSQILADTCLVVTLPGPYTGDNGWGTPAAATIRLFGSNVDNVPTGDIAISKTDVDIILPAGTDISVQFWNGGIAAGTMQLDIYYIEHEMN